MNINIPKEIQEVFRQRGGIPLFYVESGSRLWGIASPDSDYDVRGFHLDSKEHYYDFRKGRDLIEIMDGDFDFVSYNLDKMFGLLAKSNPTVLEWLRAHIVYHNTFPDFDSFRDEVLNLIDYRALYHHYLSIAKGQYALMESGRVFTYKKVFYCIRGLMSAEIARNFDLPALLIDELLDQGNHRKRVWGLAQASLKAKKAEQEKTPIPEEKRAHILDVLKSEIEYLQNKAPEPSQHQDQLVHLLKSYAFDLKSKAY